MKVAIADPPYLGQAYKKYGRLHTDAAEYDRLETHQRLIERLCLEFDAWALCLHTPSLQAILPLCPADVRVLAWVKPFASFKPGVGLAYAWEPVIVRGCRSRDRSQPTVRDWLAENITLRRGLVGAKPDRFCFWLFDALNLIPTDDLVDLFPGTGAIGRAWVRWQHQAPEQFMLTNSPGATTG